MKEIFSYIQSQAETNLNCKLLIKLKNYQYKNLSIRKIAKVKSYIFRLCKKEFDKINQAHYFLQAAQTLHQQCETIYPDYITRPDITKLFAKKAQKLGLF